MTKIAIVCQRAYGHVIPAVGLGVELRHRGHDVLMMTHISHQALIERAGLRLVPIGWGMFPDQFIPELLEEVSAALEKEQVDLLICDSSQAAPSFAAENKGIAWASFQTNLPLEDNEMPGNASVNRRMRDMYRDKLNAVRKKYGLPTLHRDSPRTRGDLSGLSPLLHLIMVIPVLVRRSMPLPPHHVIVGPCSYREPLPSSPRFHDAVRRQHPVILVCTSSNPHHEFRSIVSQYVQASAQAFSGLLCTVLMTGSRDLLPNDCSPNIEWIEEDFSHDALLQHADIVITHGSSGTVQRVLKHGLPMIIIPLGHDHPILAKRLQELGVSVTLEENRISEANLRQAFDMLMHDQSYKQRASFLSDGLEQLQANQQAADCIETLIGERKNPR